MSRAPEVDFRPYDPVFAADPYAVYARLREESPVFYSRQVGLTLFARHDDVRSLVLDGRLGRSIDRLSASTAVERPGGEERWKRLPNYSRYVRSNLLETEGPDHARVRRLVAAAFSPRRVQELRERVRARVVALLERREHARRMDFVADVATQLPVQVIADLLGWPETELHCLRPWSARIVRLYEKDCTAEDDDVAERAVAQFAARLARLAAERRVDPRDDLVSALVEIHDQRERLSMDELIATCMLLLNAGHEATANAAGNGLWALLLNPAQLDRLRGDAALLPTAVEEMLRYDAPLQLFHRYVLEDMECGGFELRRGDQVGLLYGSANRDPRAFERADEFDVGRTPNRHLAFGGGTHFCLGAMLARLELEELFGAVLRSRPVIQLDGQPPRHRPGLVFRGLESLPLRW